MRPIALLLPAVAVSALLLIGCGGGGGDGSPTAFPTSSDPARNIPAEQRNKINVVIAGSDWYVGDNNFVFGITDKQDQPQGGAKARATLYDLRDPKNPKPVQTLDAVQSAPGVGPEVKHAHATGDTHVHGGQDESRVGYFVRAKFTYAGPWGIAVEAELKDGTKGIASVGFDVAAKPSVPAPGQVAFKSDNLTKRDVANIKEIDSGDPPNDMHDVKIKDAIAAGRPVMIVFSTPAFCTSRFCGPVNEEVEALQVAYRDKVDFVHVEIWKNFDKKELNATAKQWLVRPDGGLSEPYVYLVDSRGVIFDRWEGPVARNIMEPGVKAVAAGQTFAK
ncbi:MAG: hypothetical protein C0506_15015 [Anaerolinea sp.]|nr:hypothetical protein [Anaerolinea sp.]